MPRKAKEPLVDTTPERIERRADRIQYWLQQRDMPALTGPSHQATKKKTTVMDRMIIGMIEKAMEGNAPAFNAIMENAFGKNTEGADVTRDDSTNAGARFNIPMSLSELEEKKNKDNEK